MTAEQVAHVLNEVRNAIGDTMPPYGYAEREKNMMASVNATCLLYLTSDPDLLERAAERLTPQSPLPEEK